jgi:hypothetical protein
MRANERKLMSLILSATALLTFLNLSWQKNASGNFEVWQDGGKLKMEVSAGSDWGYNKNYVDNHTNPSLVVAPRNNSVQVKPILLVDPAQHQVDWAYLYWGDGTGTFVNEFGSWLSHTYNQKSRYNPSLIASIDGSVEVLTFYLMDDWASGEDPTEWPRPSFTPPTTYNHRLNQTLSTLAIDNSGYVSWQTAGGGGCSCVGEGELDCEAGGCSTCFCGGVGNCRRCPKL